MTMTASPTNPAPADSAALRYRPFIHEMHVNPHYNWLHDASDDDIAERLHYNETHI